MILNIFLCGFACEYYSEPWIVHRDLMPNWALRIKWNRIDAKIVINKNRRTQRPDNRL